MTEKTNSKSIKIGCTELEGIIIDKPPRHLDSSKWFCESSEVWNLECHRNRPHRGKSLVD